MKRSQQGNRAHRVTFLWATCSDGLSGQCPRMMSVTTAKFRVDRVRYIQVLPVLPDKMPLSHAFTLGSRITVVVFFLRLQFCRRKPGC